MGLNLIINTLYKTLLDNVDMSSNQSAAIESIEGITCYAIQCNWTGFNDDTNAIINIYGSNNGKIFTQVNSIIPQDATGSFLLNVEKAAYRFVKIEYTQSSASGILTAVISGKII